MILYFSLCLGNIYYQKFLFIFSLRKLCVAINLNWDYLLIDEPFSNLDYDGIKIFKEIFENFKSENKSIIFSTHQNDDNSFCDKVVIVEDFKEI